VGITEELLERDAVLRSLDVVVESARLGQGGAVVVEGAPGVGKTSLLRAAAADASHRGLEVRWAQGGELEQSLAWGVARDLLAGPARRLGDIGLAAAGAALGFGDAAGRTNDPLAVAYALTELCGELATQRPLLLVVDDAHWADALSVRWLAHLASRLGSMPIALAVAARPHDPRRPDELAVLAGRDAVRVDVLGPLSRDGTAALVRRVLPLADDELCAACHEASGGNAFLIVELARELVQRAGRPRNEDIAEIAIDRIDRIVARRLVSVGDQAARLAQAAAVCGAHARAADVAAIAELDDNEAAAAADSLRGADIVDRVGDGYVFVHPLLRSAVERAVPRGRRTSLHLRAARHLEMQGEPIERVGAHLLAAEPGTDPWVRSVLVAAGDAAMSAGAPQNAMAMYERAMAERVGNDPVLLTKFGRAAMRVDPSAAVAPLRTAMAATTGHLRRTEIALDLAVVLQTLQRFHEAVAMLDELAADLARAGAPRAARLRIEAELLSQGFFDLPGRQERLERLKRSAQEVVGQDDEEALIVVQLATEAINTATVEDVRRLCEKAWLDGRLVDLVGSVVSPSVQFLPYLYMYIDEPDWSLAVADQWLLAARQQGATVVTCYAEAIRAESLRRRGDLLDGRAAAEVAWSIAAELGRDFPGWWISVGALAQALIGTGEPGAAFALLEREGLLAGPPPDMMLLPLPRAIRAECLLAAGDVDRGVAELLETADWVEAQGEPSPGAWHYPAALVDGLLAQARRSEASAVARAWLARTEAFGALTTLGMAQRAVALTETGETQLQGLWQAETTLKASPSKSEHARALLEVGAALRRCGQRAAAREPLSRALDQATRCGAALIAARARDELTATGARPRRDRLTGVDALSPSERRVADLVATGMTNREVASALFISRKTVEHHLGSLYTKLGTNDRARLAELLGRTALD